MKRYNIFSMLEPGRPIMEQETELNPTGKWVKYEPWMEQDENAEYFTIPIKGDKTLVFKKPKYISTGADFAATAGIKPIYHSNLERLADEIENYKPKEPTICVECRNYHPCPWTCNNEPRISHWCKIPMVNIDHITGEKHEEIQLCQAKNHGNCPDFKPKNEKENNQ